MFLVAPNKIHRFVRLAAAGALTSWLIAGAVLPTQLAHADSNVAYPVPLLEQTLGFGTWSIDEVRGARFEEDFARRGMLTATGGETFAIKLRPARRRDTFNNVPRYEVAAYHVQKLFLDPEEYVVPPTVFRAFPLDTASAWGASELEQTYEESDQIFFVIQYWLQNVFNPPDPLDLELFEQDPSYARHIANLNVLTYLIQHKDANQGNILLSADPGNPRVFSVDNGVTLSSAESEQGSIWKEMRVPAVPADTVERVRAIDIETLRENLLVFSEHRFEGGHYVPVEVSEPLSRRDRVRRRGGLLQLGLTERELRSIMRQRARLLSRINFGLLETF